MTTIINHAHNSGATMEWNGYLWVAKFGNTRYADNNSDRLRERLYDAGASVVFEEIEMPTPKANWRERYKRIANCKWFKQAYNGMSVGERINVE